MPSNNSKYTQETREKTARYVLETGKSTIKALADLVSGENLLPHSWSSSYNLLMWWAASGVSFIRTLIPFMVALPS